MNPFINTIVSRPKNTFPLGSFILSASPIIAEAMGLTDFDWLIIDGEHSPVDLRDIAAMLQAVGSTPAWPVVRLPWNDAVIVKRVMDAGATTLMFPFIQSAAEARQAVMATRYPPDGIRGMAGLSRASRFGAIPEYFARANDSVGVIVQLESRQALDNLDAISAIEGVDAIFLGPTDLAGAMGHGGRGDHPEVQTLLAATAHRCRSLGIPVGTVAANPAAALRLRDAGFDFIAISSDLGLMLGQARQYAAAFRGSRAEAPGPSPTANSPY
ncbi:MAG: aldolase/citrate lyase family protein [Pigmentiphaga sp.]|nr:aldolase/citrate lyase family protein [Pigmentiphaga sp.]